MKGTPDPPTGYVFTQVYSKDDDERYSSDNGNISPTPSSPTACCQKCLEADRQNTKISWKRDKCRCFNGGDNQGTCTSTGGQCKADEYISGICTFLPGKKKREVSTFEEIAFSNEQPSEEKKSSYWQSSIAPTHQLRERRSVDNAVVRQISCQGIWSDTAAQWSYQYEVPEYCFSNVHYCISFAKIPLQE